MSDTRDPVEIEVDEMFEDEDAEPDWAPLCRCETCSPDNITCVSKD
jgi:hypothetical protein